MRLAKPLERLIEELQKLPSIGPKSAQRLALHIVKRDEEEVNSLAQAIKEAKAKIVPCQSCACLTEENPCYICSDLNRDGALLCVAEDINDILALEKTGYNGRYYVIDSNLNLGGMSRLEQNKLEKFSDKISSGLVKEVIIALNPDMEGEITSRYLAKIANKYQVKTTKLAYGLPFGGDIEYLDEITLRKALEGRSEVE